MLSFIIPVYNTQIEIVNRCYYSILKSGVHDFEVIIVDDGSEEAISLEIKKLISANTKYIYQHNQGVSKARNNGLEMASGKYVMYVDSDDELVENSLNDDMFTGNADLILFDLAIVGGNKNLLYSFDFQKQTVSGHDVIDKIIKNSILGSPCARAYSIARLKESGLAFNDELVSGEDISYNIQYLSSLEGCTVNYYHKSVYRYHWKPASDLERTQRLNTKILSSVLYVFLQKKEYIDNIAESGRKVILEKSLNEGLVESLFSYIGSAKVMKVFDRDSKELVDEMTRIIQWNSLMDRKPKIKYALIKMKLYGAAEIVTQLKRAKEKRL